ncbi:MAG: DUF4345 family protein [Anaerolineaceae bacterium]|jgi:hypothetical protein|nr:DUF4345 family protein [Anaerolineaceae bacterium]
MNILTILKIIIAVGTIGTGLLALLKPNSIDGFTGIKATGPRGVTEIRAIFGGLFIGLGAAAILLNAPAAYQMLGIAYGAIAVVRIPAMFLDHSVENSNIISTVIEVVFAVILVL